MDNEDSTADDGTSFTLEDYNRYREDSHRFPDGGPELVKFFDEWAEKRIGFRSVVDFKGPASLASILTELLADKSSRILDAASGGGMVGDELKSNGFTCIDALDSSQKAMDSTKPRHIYTDYICDTLDEHKTTIPNDHYDAVVMCGAFGLPGHVTDACFPELVRITKRGGYIVFTASDIVLQNWEAKMKAAIQAMCQNGLWELVEYRTMPYLVTEGVLEKAMVPILRVL